MGKDDQQATLSALYLGSLVLEGFRGFKDGTCIDFTNNEGHPAQWTVILGENGTAKTGVLQALAGLSPIYDESLAKSVDQDTSDPDMPLSGWRPKAVDGSEWISWWHRNLPRNRKSDVSESKLYIQFCASEQGIESASAEVNKRFKGIPSDSQWGAGIKLEQSKNGQAEARLTFRAAGGYELGRFQVFGYGATRLVDHSESRSQTRNSADSLFSEYDILESPEQWLLKLDHGKRFEEAPEQKQKAEAAFESAKRCIIAVLPDIEDVKIEKTEWTVSADSAIRAKFKCPYGWVFFEELGQGYQSMASWAVDLLQQLHRKYPELDNPEKGPAVALIDEFDLHLHPKWQLSLMDHLGGIFENTQFIITAHSPLIIQAAGPETNIVVLRKDTDEEGVNWIVADSDPIHVRGWRLDQIITSDLFGLSSARPKEYADLFEKRSKLVSKTNRSEDEDSELRQITRKIEREAPFSISGEAADILEELRAAN